MRDVSVVIYCTHGNVYLVMARICLRMAFRLTKKVMLYSSINQDYDMRLESLDNGFASRPKN